MFGIYHAKWGSSCFLETYPIKLNPEMQNHSGDCFKRYEFPGLIGTYYLYAAGSLQVVEVRPPVAKGTD